MFWLCRDASWTVCSWWWVVPLIGIALCITMCIFFSSRSGNRRFACWSGGRRADFDEIKKEITKLKIDIEKIRDQRGG
jgi:hypothetical protein